MLKLLYMYKSLHVEPVVQHICWPVDVLWHENPVGHELWPIEHICGSPLIPMNVT